jgi:PHD/YefM family antitoxin component YafN of YafNO toxin-antitoxin module
MAATTVSFEEFQKDADRVDEASVNGPVFVTRPGRKTLVVLDMEEYRKLSGKEPSIVDLLSYPGAGEIDFEPPRMGTEHYRPVDLFD